jgi:two-component system sensor histidine kinase MprB
MTRLPLRANIALLCAATTAIAIVAGAVLAWTATRHTLREQVDASLGQRIGRFDVVATGPDQVAPPGFEAFCDVRLPDRSGGDELPRTQLLRADGTACSNGDRGDRVDPVDREYAVARGEAGPVMRDATTADGEHVRSLTQPLADGYALQVTRSLEEVDATLRELAMVLGLSAALGVLLAGGAGLLVARLVLRPVDRLTAAAEHVAETEDLDVPIEVAARFGHRDEVTRLSLAFNAMTSRLAGSRRRQQQLIADSSHELRTPLTSLRTNVEWLMRADDRGRPLAPRQKRQVEQAVLGQIDELSTLIAELGALAREEPVRSKVPTDLDAVVLRAVERAQRRDPSRRFDLDVEPWRVCGDAATLERAVLNLVDNALKFSDEAIGVSLRDGRVTVTDRGPGLAEPEQAFDRFWRAPTARELPGSGLGLAIVADTAADHGGAVFFTATRSGGSAVGFALPPLTELSAGPRALHIPRS